MEIKWDLDTERFFETGVDHCILFPKTGLNGAYAAGVAWNGVSAINENPSGAEANPIYADNMKYLNLVSNEEFGFSIEAYMAPDDFAVCDGSVQVATGVYIGQQARKEFGLYYRTNIGSDDKGDSAGYKHHFVWNALAAPSGREHSTINESPEAMSMSWDCTTTAIDVDDSGDYKKIAHLVIDSRTANSTKLAALLETVMGTDGGTGTEGTDPTLPTPSQIITAMSGT